MTLTGATVTPQQIPNAKLPVVGEQGSRSTFFLRSTPKIFGVLVQGSNNADFIFQAVPNDIERVRFLKGSRFTQHREGTLKTGQITFPIVLTIATAGVGSGLGNSIVLPLVCGITTSGIRRSAGTALLGISFGSEVAVSGSIPLPPEISFTLTLSSETEHGLTLSSEVSGTLTLTPEQ